MEFTIGLDDGGHNKKLPSVDGTDGSEGMMETIS